MCAVSRWRLPLYAGDEKRRTATSQSAGAGTCSGSGGAAATSSAEAYSVTTSKGEWKISGPDPAGGGEGSSGGSAGSGWCGVKVILGVGLLGSIKQRYPGGLLTGREGRAVVGM